MYHISSMYFQDFNGSDHLRKLFVGIGLKSRPPVDKTNLLKKKYTALLVELKTVDIKNTLVKYGNVIDRTNWLRKLSNLCITLYCLEYQ